MTVTILCEVQGFLSGGDGGDVTVVWPAALPCCHWDAECKPVLRVSGCLLVVCLGKTYVRMQGGKAAASLWIPPVCSPQEGSESIDDCGLVNKSFTDGLKGPAAVFITHSR